ASSPSPRATSTRASACCCAPTPPTSPPPDPPRPPRRQPGAGGATPPPRHPADTATCQLHLPPASVPSTVNPAAGEAAKQVGVAQAEAATAPDWAAACQAAIAVMAARGVVFQAADLIAEGLVDEPDHPSRWGAAFGRAARAG